MAYPMTGASAPPPVTIEIAGDRREYAIEAMTMYATNWEARAEEWANWATQHQKSGDIALAQRAYREQLKATSVATYFRALAVRIAPENENG